MIGLKRHLCNKRPNKQAVSMLKGLAKKLNRPELGERLEGTWRREQIAAIVQAMLQDDDTTSQG